MLDIHGLAILLLVCTGSHAFTPSRILTKHHVASRISHTWANQDDTSARSLDPLDDLSDERKASLFQYLLRDLQIEGFPWLAVDADQVDTLQAAMWTTIAEICDSPNADKACMVFEELPVSHLTTFVDNFMSTKKEELLMPVLPELERVSLSLVGKGIGPAIVIDVKQVKPEDMLDAEEENILEPQVSAATKAFFARIADKTVAYPCQEKETPVAFKLCRRSDVPHILSAFWNSLCELRVTKADTLASTVLMIPGMDHNHARFAAISELLSRSLRLFGGDNDFDLLYYFPEYDRNQIHPNDQVAFGHIPPLCAIRAMLEHNGDSELAKKMSDDKIALSNYQRRSPTTAVKIKRVALIGLDERNTNVEICLDDNEQHQVAFPSNEVRLYAENAKLLASEGEHALRASLSNEMSILH